MRLRTASTTFTLRRRCSVRRETSHGLSQGSLVLFLCDHKVVLTPEGAFESWSWVSYLLVQNREGVLTSFRLRKSYVLISSPSVSVDI